MKAVVLQSPRAISVESVEDAVYLHIYEGRLGDGSPMVIGHEPLVVESVGSDVVNVRVGDRVTVPTHICCGFCANCVADG